jgi:hypothetical protein
VFEISGMDCAGFGRFIAAPMAQRNGLDLSTFIKNISTYLVFGLLAEGE